MSLPGEAFGHQSLIPHQTQKNSDITPPPPRVEPSWKWATDWNSRHLFKLYQLWNLYFYIMFRSVIAFFKTRTAFLCIFSSGLEKPSGPLWLIVLRCNFLPLHVRNGVILAAEWKSFHLIQRLEVQPQKARRRKENTTKSDAGSSCFAINPLLCHIFVTRRLPRL